MLIAAGGRKDVKQSLQAVPIAPQYELPSQVYSHFCNRSCDKWIAVAVAAYPGSKGKQRRKIVRCSL